MKNRNIFSISIKKISILFTLFLALTTFLHAEPLTGRDIIQKVDSRKSGETSKNLTTMTLVSKRGKERVREILSYTRDYGDVEKTVMIFLAPADVKGIGYLTYAYEDKGTDDDTWLFLPALKKVRRISGSSRNDYFMGTDFTYDDMGDREIDEDTHTLIKEEIINENTCWVVESFPVDKTYMYSKRVSWINQDNLITVKVDYYDRQGKLLKQLTVSDLSLIDGIWSAGIMEMNNIQDKHKTRLEKKDVQFNLEVNDSYFRVSTLERGRIR